MPPCCSLNPPALLSLYTPPEPGASTPLPPSETVNSRCTAAPRRRKPDLEPRMAPRPSFHSPLTCAAVAGDWLGGWLRDRVGCAEAGATVLLSSCFWEPGCCDERARSVLWRAGVSMVSCCWEWEWEAASRNGCMLEVRHLVRPFPTSG
jgi:hypothetical protein